MRVIVLVKATKDSEQGIMPTTEMLEAMGRYNEELVNAGIMKAGDGLKPSSQGKRVAFDGAKRRVIDGPFAATSELVAGFWLWEVKDMDEAVAWAIIYAGLHGVTAKAEVRFREPARVGMTLFVRAWLLDPGRRLVRAKAEAREGSEDGRVVAELDAVMATNRG